MASKCLYCDFSCCVVVQDPADPPGGLRTLCMLHFYGSKYATKQWADCIRDWNLRSIRAQKVKAEGLVTYLAEEVIETIQRQKEKKASRAIAQREAVKHELVTPEKKTVSSLKRKRKQTWDVSKGERKFSSSFTISNSSESKLAKKVKSIDVVSRLQSTLFSTPQEQKRFNVCVMFSNSLIQDLDEADAAGITKALRIAVDVEAILSSTHGEGGEYRSHARLLGQALADSKNQELRERLLSVKISPKKLCDLKGPELANPEVTSRRSEEFRKFTKQRIKLGEQQEATPTDQYTCPSCGKKDAKFKLMKAPRNSNKSETWGNKDNEDSNEIKLFCNPCGHVWIRNM